MPGENGINKKEGNNQSELTLLEEHPDFEHWDNVVTVGGGTGVYLGQSGDVGYVLTAKHLGTKFGSIQIAGTNYGVVSSKTYGSTDLRVFGVSGGLSGISLPALPSVTIATTDPSVNDPLLMLGRGTRGGSSPDMVTMGSYEVYTWAGAGDLSWGTNEVSTMPWTGGKGFVDDWRSPIGTVESSFFAVFDDQTGLLDPNDWEAMAGSGDSGGPVFIQREGEWQLAGITSTTYKYGTQSSGTSAYGNATSFVNLAEYEDQLPDIEKAVLADVPEPSAFLLMVLGTLGVMWRRGR